MPNHVERPIHVVERHHCPACRRTFYSHGAYTLHECVHRPLGSIPFPMLTVWQEAWLCELGDVGSVRRPDLFGARDANPPRPFVAWGYEFADRPLPGGMFIRDLD